MQRHVAEMVTPRPYRNQELPLGLPRLEETISLRLQLLL